MPPLPPCVVPLLLALLAQTPAAVPPVATPAATWLLPSVIGFIVGTVPLMLFFLTRRARQADDRQGVAIHAEQLFIGGSQELIRLLQSELTRATSRLAGAESERDRLRGEIHELTLVFEANKLQHRALTELMTRLNIALPRPDADGAAAAP